MSASSPPSPAGSALRAPRWVAALLFISGAVALVYEVIWQRQFALVFGSGAPATASVLAAYFTGLGAGSLVVGRLARHSARPLRGYAALEGLAGLGALLVAPCLGLVDRGYPWLFQHLSAHPGGFVAVRTFLAFAALALPTFCLGGTLPLLGPILDRGQRRLGVTAGWLYVANTTGAGVGALLVPFVLLPRLGISATIMACAAVNALLALAALALDRSWHPPAESALLPARSVQPPAGNSPVLWAAAFSGVATFALQVLWNRAFAQVHENSMYSFAVIVSVVIFALALGAQLARIGLRRGLPPARLVAAAWTLGGLAIVAGPWLFLSLSRGLAYLPGDRDWTRHALDLVGLAAGVVLPPMTLLGIALPALMEQAGRRPDGGAARALGHVLAANVAGSVVGALTAGYVLPHLLGLWPGMLALGALLLAVGLWPSLRGTGPGRRRRAFAGLAVGALASAGLIARLDLPRVSVATAQHERLVALAEGTHGITAVVERPGSRRLKLNNHYGLGGTASTGDERMQAHVPLLLHAAPRRVAFLGLGTGISAGGALFHPVGQVTVVELVPEVVDAARVWFRDANHGVLDDPRTRVVPDDARNFLRGSGEHFDVIVGDLVVPWRQGEGSLFTLEQFAAARRALAPGGVFCQWLPLFQLSETEVELLARTFLAVFPRAQVWRGDFSPTEPAIALIGGDGAFPLDAALVRRRLTAMEADPLNPQLRSPEAFWMNFAGVLEAGDLPPGELNREDHPWIELLGPLRPAGPATLTGRRLQIWLSQPALRTPSRLAGLADREISAMAAGDLLAEMTLCLAEGDRTGALSARQRLQQALPPEASRLLFP